MNVHRIACSLAFAILAAPAAALACTDGGPPNRICNDGGAEWIVCTDHAQCPEGQYCSAQGACGCGGRDAGVCDDSGCHGCEQWPVDGGSCSRPRFVCPDPTVADAAVDVVARLDRVAGAAVGAASAATAGAALLAAAALAGAFLPAAALLVAGLLAVGVTVTSEDATLRGAAAATARWLPESTSTVIPCSSKARTTVLSRRAGTPAVSNAVRRSAPAMLPRVAPRAKSCCRAGWENSVGKGADDFAGPEDTRDTGTDYLSQYTLTSAHGRARPSGRARRETSADTSTTPGGPLVRPPQGRTAPL